MKQAQELQTLRDFIRWAVSTFNEAGLVFGHGTATAWDEAIALIFHALYLPHDIHPTVFDARLTQVERDKLIHLIHERVKKRIPLPYLIHEAWFAGLSFYVDERVLIPRSPVAELIENQFQPWLPHPEEVTAILDLCTGSGCIAVACGKAFPEVPIDASDISSDALTVAKINVLRHHLEDQITLHLSDLFMNLPPKKYDIIVSNPPYVDAEDMANLPEEYLHEPKLGLAAGKDGLDFVSRILKEARSYLKPSGILIVEVGNSEIALAKQYPHIPFTWLDFQRGDGGVFLLTGEELADNAL